MDVHEADVLVVGSGAAAFSAAIAAKQQGAEVIMLEKAPLIGGTTLRSGGGYWIPDNRFQRELGIADEKDDAIRYMARYSFPHLYNPEALRLGLPEHEYSLLDTYVDTASKAVDFLEDCGAVHSIQEINWTGSPQVDYMDHLPENKGIRGRVLYSKDKDGKMSYGGELVRQLKLWATTNGITMLTDHRVTDIVENDLKQVVGLKVLVNGDKVEYFHSRKAVVFGSGGFTHNPELMLHFQRGPHFGGCAAPTNTGDFIRMAGLIGAKLGNMANAFRAEIVVEQALANPEGVHNVFYIPGDSVIEVNRYGHRIMDEKRNYSDRTMTHFVWDPQRAEWTNMLVFMIFDRRTASLWQGYPPYPVEGTPADHSITADSWSALAKGISKRLEELSAHTGGFTIDAGFEENLVKTVARFNEFARTGKDLDFSRGDFAYDREWTTFPPTVPGTQWPPQGSENYTMFPLSDEGPYYAIILGAGTLDTNGGPVINNRSQVLDCDDKVIPGLYGAGNCIASPTANAYWGAGSTIGPALTFGHIAGLNAAAEPEKEGWAQ
ncbi:MAG: FAD-dependent oxidoreductase [Actinobacteria bacterium]|nr:FAD-dependent oxidoreductase [Actinomycetota bacterium]